METFSLKYRIPLNKYRKFVFIHTYKKPIAIISVISGIYFLSIYFSEPENKSLNLNFLICGILLLSIHALTALLLVARVRKAPYFSEELAYEIGENGISIVGTTFKAEYKWVHFIKVREDETFIILYQSKREVLFLMKQHLTSEQTAFIWSKCSQAGNTGRAPLASGK